MITQSVDAGIVDQWTEEIEDAERRRATHPDVMDIMGTRGDKRALIVLNNGLL